MGLVIWEPFPPGVWHDDGVYVLLSRALANGEGLRYTGVPGAFLAPKFPPLYPLVLAPVWIISPSFPENAAFFGAVNLLFLAVSGGLMMAYLRQRLDLSAGLAGVVVGLAVISPVLWRVAMIPLSEPLFLLTMILPVAWGSQCFSGGREHSSFGGDGRMGYGPFWARWRSPCPGPSGADGRLWRSLGP
jgi:hypothetical protein